MRIKKEFLSNFLSKPHYLWGKDFVIIVLGLCGLMSWLYWNQDFSFASKIAANYQLVFEQNEYWRLFTTSFVHADLKHLLSNSFMLGILTYFVSSFYGARISVLLAFMVSGLTNLIVLKIYGGSVNLVGASGVVFYLWGFWMVLYMFIQRQLSFMGRFLRMGAVFLVLLIPNEYQPNTSYLAHYIGFAFGVLFGSLYYLVSFKNIHKFEKWDIKFISDELTEFDLMALNYDNESVSSLQSPAN